MSERRSWDRESCLWFLDGLDLRRSRDGCSGRVGSDDLVVGVVGITGFLVGSGLDLSEFDGCVSGS